MAEAQLIIGLTGSIGAGKSTVAAIIEKQYPVLNTDRIARDIMEHDDAVRDALTEEFGIQAYLSDGSLNRTFVAELVFEDEKKLTTVNSIVHPPTVLEVRRLAAEHHAKGKRLVFVESALIYEAALDTEFDYIVAVISDMETVLRRIMKRDDLTERSVRRRMRLQLPPEEKAELADFTIRNNSSLEALEKSTNAILSILSRLQPRPSE